MEKLQKYAIEYRHSNDPTIIRKCVALALENPELDNFIDSYKNGWLIGTVEEFARVLFAVREAIK